MFLRAASSPTPAAYTFPLFESRDVSASLEERGDVPRVLIAQPNRLSRLFRIIEPVYAFSERVAQERPMYLFPRGETTRDFGEPIRRMS